MSDGSYEIPEGVIYSFPVRCKNGKYEIVQGLSVDEFSRKKMTDTYNELKEEKVRQNWNVELGHGKLDFQGRDCLTRGSENDFIY